MRDQARHGSEAKRTTVLFALPLVILGAPGALGLYREHMKQRHTRDLVGYIERGECAAGLDCYVKRPTISWLIDNGADVNARLSSGQSLVEWCAWQQQSKFMEHLQRAGARVDARASRVLLNMELLQSAGSLSKVKSALARGADVNFSNQGRTPLEEAALDGSAAGVAYLISQGARPVSRESGATLLRTTLVNENWPVLRLLLKAGASDAATEMHFAVIESRAGDVQKYLRQRVPVDAATAWDRRTALMLAASHGNTRMVRLLLHHGANPNQPDRRGSTALSHAELLSVHDGRGNKRSAASQLRFRQTIALLKRAARS